MHLSSSASNAQYRATVEPLLPVRPIRKKKKSAPSYDRYPTHPIKGDFFIGFPGLVQNLSGSEATLIAIDGYAGIIWDDFISQLSRACQAADIHSVFIPTTPAFKTAPALEALLAPYLGGDDPEFGVRCPLSLEDFFDQGKIEELKRQVKKRRQAFPPKGKLFCVGTGAAKIITDPDALWYLDCPKNEIQFRARAGRVSNLGARESASPREMYKRFYFVDWPVLNREKERLLGRVDLFIDGQRLQTPLAVDGDLLRRALEELAQQPFRVRPWFEPGVWGGQWLKRSFAGLNQSAVNYAWSFELITPENGILLESGGHLLEISFDCLMYAHSASILGSAASLFGSDFPIRFDYLDTVEGDNLSIQVHPKPGYITSRFGEPFTQMESYYLMHSEPDAKVYLGMTAAEKIPEFKEELVSSVKNKDKVEIEKYVQCHPARRHDLFLIPPGTVHGSGRGNLVLEISSTPYIFTFKIYDWLRPDLDGKPRPLNIERGLANLDPTYSGEYVTNTLISKPQVILETESLRLVRLPTTKWHFYEIYRYEFDRQLELHAEDSLLVCMVVEGNYIEISHREKISTYAFAETFIIPQAAGTVTCRNNTGVRLHLLCTRLKQNLVKREDGTIGSDR